jgi:Ca-activated chloride channel family protein
MRGRSEAVALIVLLVGPGIRVAESQTARTPTFEVGIDVTNLDVSVREGRSYVGDLARNDFAVYEDGVRQDVSLFVHEWLPISLTIMIDVSASMSAHLPVAQKAATGFLSTLQPGDKAAVMTFNSRIATLVDFTEDRAALEAAIARTEASGATALHNALYVALKDLARQKTPGQLRRRAIVLLSDGEDTASLVTDEQVVDLARKTEVGIYAISLRAERDADHLRQHFSQAAFLLTTLAQESGGRVYFPASLSELDEVYGRIAEELRTLYSIGYVSNNRRRDGKWRRIVVRVPSREGLEVRYKIGYYGPKG